VTGARAAFIDRDGVLNELVPDPESGLPESPLHPDEVRLLPDVGPALKELAAAGYLLVGVSNQPAAAKGKVALEELLSVQERVVDLLAAEGVHFERFNLCLHHPQGTVEGLRGPCDCRKPAPGMLLEAAEELSVDLSTSWMIGDSDTDIGAGRNAGVRTVLVEYQGSSHKRSGVSQASFRSFDLKGAIRTILNG
jgi:D-glycero-D-manno-heptose 1,7-bisphosphate phosphatase